MSNVSQLVEKFEEAELGQLYLSIVYAFYDGRTDEWLYVGQAKDGISRLDDHLNSHRGSDLLGNVDRDDQRDVYADAKEYMRRHVKVKYVEVPDNSERNRVEKQLIRSLAPRYNKQ